MAGLVPPPCIPLLLPLPPALVPPLPLVSVVEDEQPRHTDTTAKAKQKPCLIECPRSRLILRAYHAHRLVKQPRRSATTRDTQRAGPRHCYFGGSLPDQPISRAVSAPTPSSANESGSRSEPAAITRLRVITSA